MQINEGNIFEAMRLVLPEHRAVMNLVTKEMNKRERPTLTEDEYTQMQYVLGEALELGQRLKIRLFHPYEDKIRVGVPTVQSNKLYVQTDEGSVQVDIKEIIRIEVV